MKNATPHPSTADNMEQIRDVLLSMAGEGQVNALVELVIDMLSKMQDQNTALQLRVHELLKSKFGRSSEKLTSEQLDMFLGILGGEAAQSTAETEATEEQVEAPSKRRKKKRRAAPHGRKPLPLDLPRVEEKHQVEGDERHCEHCGVDRVCIGHEASEVLEFEPARLFVRSIMREKLACPNTDCEGGVVVAPAPLKVIDKGLPGPGLLADIVVNKYKDHLPLYRQQQRYARLGVDLSRSTLGAWVAAAADLLSPLAERLGELALAAYLLQTDDTHLKVMDDRRKPAIKKGALWCYIGDSLYVYFHYTPTREQKGPLAFLQARVGWLQADGYTGYDALFKGAAALAIEVGCWMHARRYFVKALDAGDMRAAWPIKQIKTLYEVEREANELNASPEQRFAMRQERSLPVLNDLGKWIAEAAKTEVPKTPMYKALTYSINQWQALLRFTEDGLLPIDNGAVERMIRIVALGRKNYLFAGSDEGARRAAILYSIMGSCTLAEVNPWEYLQDVLMKLAGDWPYARLDELLPSEWKKRQASKPPDDASCPPLVPD